MAFKFVLMLSVVVFAAQASPTPDHHDDQTKINAAQTILTLTNSLVGIKNLLTEMNTKLTHIQERDNHADIFSVYNSNPKGTPPNSVVTYDHVNTDAKHLIDLETGVFTVKTPGIYQISFQGMSHNTAAGGNDDGTLVELKVNGVSHGATFAQSGMRNALTILTVLHLNRADKVSVHVRENGLHEYHDASIYFTHFNGELLHEE